MPLENTEPVQSDALGKPRRGRLFLLQHRLLLPALLCIVVLTAFLVLLPLYFYVALQMDVETGDRCTHLGQLARCYPFGRVLARYYVSREFASTPPTEWVSLWASTSCGGE